MNPIMETSLHGTWAFTHQCVDLTPYVLPGKSYRIRIFVRAYQVTDAGQA